MITNFFFFSHAHGMWKLPDQGSNLSHSRDSARSLTSGTTRELHEFMECIPQALSSAFDDVLACSTHPWSAPGLDSVRHPFFIPSRKLTRMQLSENGIIMCKPTQFQNENEPTPNLCQALTGSRLFYTFSDVLKRTGLWASGPLALSSTLPRKFISQIYTSIIRSVCPHISTESIPGAGETSPFIV